MDQGLEYALELFEPLGEVSHRRMFGGVGFFRHGLMFALTAYDEIYLKTDDENRVTFEDAGCKPFVFEAQGVEKETSYWSLPEQAHDDEDERMIWLDQAWQAALGADAAKPPAKRKLKEF